MAKIEIKKRWFTVKEVAIILGFSENTIRNKIKEKEIKAIELFSAYRISENEIDRLTKDASTLS